MALIPAERLTQWVVGETVGVYGGIPTGRTMYANAVTEGADNTGVVDATGIINALLAACPGGQYVYLPAGTYLISGSILIQNGKSGITLRGDGIGQTIIEVHGTNGIFVGAESDYIWNEPAGDMTITAGMTKGSTEVTIASAADFTVGQLCRIAWENQIDDTAIEGGATPVFNDNGDSREQRKQMVRITAKTATTITFEPAIHHEPQAGLASRINHARIISSEVGIEELTLECENVEVATGVKFEQCLNCWMKNVEVRHTFNYPIFFYDSLFCEMRGCFANEGKDGGSNGAGLLMNNCGGCLIEDNIVYKVFPGFEINQGSSGNVFAYNLLEGTATVAGTMNVNHGPHNSHNLYEGNIAPTVQCDGLFGTASEDTIFRNWFSGTNSVGAYQASLVSLNRFTRNYSLVGNILGNPAWPYGPNPYSFGNPNMGNSFFQGYATPSAGDFWLDWKMTAELITRTSDTEGVIELISGSMFTTQFRSYCDYGEIVAPVVLTGGIVQPDGYTWTYAGGTVSITVAGPLPEVNTVFTIWAGGAGFQDIDEDVEATTILKANYHNWEDGGDEIPAGQDPAPDTVPSSLFRSSKPDFFGALAWPPINPYDPTTANYEAIPASYRYVNGSNPPEPGTGTMTCETLNVTTLTLG